MSPELGLIVAPGRTYAALAARPSGVPAAITAARRPLAAAAALGVSVAMAATGRVIPALVLSTTLTWSYVIVLQVAIALLLIAPGARRTIGVARALDLFFAGHAPWSLAMIAIAAVPPSPDARVWAPAAVALVAIALTVRIVDAFFRGVLGAGRRRALRLTLLHQAITWSVFVAMVWWLSALTPRALRLVTGS